MSKQFFEEAKEQSIVKAAIVRKYFMAWFTAIKGAVRRHGNRVHYLDLFAGPGRYDDDTISTPLLILEEAIKHDELREMLVTTFNDKDSNSSRTLEQEISRLPGIDKLKYKPTVLNEEIGTRMVKNLETTNLVPTLFFVDPWGYKGLSLKLINSVLKDLMCECIFFFNYNRINMGLSNELVQEHMNALFGEERAAALRPRLEKLGPDQRELAIVEAISEALIEMGGKYVLPFRFKRPDGGRTSHHLIFVSKHPLGYKIMKEVMARESSGTTDGVPTFEYNPSYRDEGLLFEFARPVSQLGELLCDEFGGQLITVSDIYEQHNYGRPFVMANYKEAIRRLEAKKTVTCDPAERRVVKGVVTMAEHVKVTFPKKKR